MMIGITVLSGTAGVQMGSLSFTGIDKLGHLLVFGLLGVAWVRVFRSPDLGFAKRLLLAVILTSGFGLLDECHQLRNPLRTFEWADLLADFLGSLLGTFTYLSIRPWQAFLELDFHDALRLRFTHKITNSRDHVR